jgi:hypothetical protein
MSILGGSWAFQGGVGSGWKELGFSLYAAPSQLAGPHISELGVELSRDGGPGRGQSRSKVKGLRSEVLRQRKSVIMEVSNWLLI